MKLTDILAPAAVIAELTGTDKDSVLEELAQAIGRASAGRIDPKDFASRLAQRCGDRSPAIGSGVAVPHARSPAIDSVIVVFGRSRPGVDFGAIDNRPAHLLFAVASAEKDPGLHLKALARISRVLKNEHLRRELQEAPDAAAIYKLIRDEDLRA